MNEYLERIHFRYNPPSGPLMTIGISTLPNETPIITKARRLFHVIDSRFETWKLTGPENIGSFTTLARFKIVKDFTFRSLLESVSTDFGSLSFSKEQVVAFAANAWNALPFDPVTTYLPLREIRSDGTVEYFVGRIFVRRDGSLEIYVYDVEKEDDEWSASLFPHLILPNAAVERYAAEHAKEDPLK